VRKSLSIVLFLFAACDLALAMDVPLPRTKPLPIANSPSVAPVPEVLPLHDAEAWPSDCALRLAEIARFANEPSLNGPGQCGASDVVRLEGIMMPNRHANRHASLPHGRSGRTMGPQRPRPGHG
jgi:hypothetical protein